MKLLWDKISALETTLLWRSHHKRIPKKQESRRYKTYMSISTCALPTIRQLRFSCRSQPDLSEDYQTNLIKPWETLLLLLQVSDVSIDERFKESLKECIKDMSDMISELEKELSHLKCKNQKLGLITAKTYFKTTSNFSPRIIRNLETIAQSDSEAKIYYKLLAEKVH